MTAEAENIHKVSKKDVIRMYNKINMEIYEAGVSQHKIETSDNRLMIFAIHRRIPALKVMRENFSELVSHANTAIASEFKKKFRIEFEQATGLKVVSILKDYDAITQYTCTIIYFDHPISAY